MAAFKCKMCGGPLEIEPGQSTIKCPYCEIVQTLPRMDSDRKKNLLQLAEASFRNHEYDKAIGYYTSILIEDITDAEIYWYLVLCNYGVQYETDTITKERTITLNRMQYTSIYEDENYKSAIKYADPHQRTIFEKEAAILTELQKEIIQIAQQKDPYDIFISFKMENRDGSRTLSSVAAETFYNEMTRAGFKVFFSPITLEDKVGMEYEPIIFSALNTASVMVVFGDKREHFEAPWVRNEWSRYLALVKQSDGKKHIFIAYMDADHPMKPENDFPKEFAPLQARKVDYTFNVDMERVIKKLIASPVSVEKSAASVSQKNDSVTARLTRAKLFLEDGDFSRAVTCCEEVLNQDAENARAYLYELMAEKRCRKEDDLQNLPEPFDNSNLYQKVIRFADFGLRHQIEGYITHIHERNEGSRKDEILEEARGLLEEATEWYVANSAYESLCTIPGWKDADALAQRALRLQDELLVREKDSILKTAEQEYQSYEIKDVEHAVILLRSISGWRHADELAEACRQKINLLETQRKDKILEQAKKAQADNFKAQLEKAAELYESIPGWKDADMQAKACHDRIAEIEAQNKRLEEQQRKEARKRAARKRNMGLLFLLLCIIGYFAVTRVILPAQNYKAGMELYEAGKYEEAMASLNKAGTYSDAKEYYQNVLSAQLMTQGVGGKITLGEYGKEAISWRILANEDGKVLLISEKCLEATGYNKSRITVNWEDCDLREWLNKDFYKKAFSQLEQDSIIETTVLNSHTEPTQDKVYILSREELEAYLPLKEDRVPVMTALAKKNGGNNWYWMRTDNTSNPHCVHGDGSTDHTGYVHDDAATVRPVIWVTMTEEAQANAKAIQYKTAIKEFESGNIQTAMELFAGLKGYEEADDYYAQTLNKAIETAEVGSVVSFGRYAQIGHELSEIKWHVLDRTESGILLFAEKCLDAHAYNVEKTAVTWADSDLRAWLNQEFLTTAFTELERSRIIETAVDNGEGGITDDHVFILSNDELNMYAVDLELRKAVPTTYAQARGGNTWYWLRKPGTASDKSECIHADADKHDGAVHDSSATVRPVIWVALNENVETELDVTRYEQAVTLFQNGDYKAAFPLFKLLGDYKDSAEYYTQTCAEVRKVAAVGDEIPFGNYIQSGDTAEPVMWRVLAREGNRLLLISTKCIEAKSYHSEHISVTWQDSALRNWLNNDFLVAAFSDEEKGMISDTILNNGEYPSTTDKVFILSRSELEGHLPNKEDRIPVVTEHAAENGGRRWYWMRTGRAKDPHCVHDDGSTNHTGWAHDTSATVRPALWIQHE